MNDRRPGNNNNNNGNNNRGQNLLWFILAALVVLLVVSTITNRIGSLTHQEISYTEFETMVENGKIDSVVITSNEIQITPSSDDGAANLVQITYYTVNLGDDRLYEFLDEHNVEYKGKNSNQSAIIYNILSFVGALDSNEFFSFIEL